MRLRTVLILGTIVMPINVANACGGGGGTASSGGSISAWAKSTVNKAYLPIRETQQSVARIPKYLKYVEDRGHSNAIHDQGSYLLGYEDGNPNRVALIRGGGEVGQAVTTYTYVVVGGAIVRPFKRYGIDIKVDKSDLPRSLQWDSVQDSFGDVKTARQGALDKQNGLPSRYPVP